MRFTWFYRQLATVLVFFYETWHSLPKRSDFYHYRAWAGGYWHNTKARGWYQVCEAQWSQREIYRPAHIIGFEDNHVVSGEMRALAIISGVLTAFGFLFGYFIL